MAETPNMEIPEAVREMAERNLGQARDAYNQMVAMASKAQEMISRSSGAMTESLLELQRQSMKYAQENIEAGFSMASDLARARDMKEYFEIQSRHAQRQMQTYARQAQDLGRLMTEAAQKAQNKG